MAQAQLVTSWPRSQLFDQTIAIVSDDPHWMVQAQTSETLLLRREKSVGYRKLLLWRVIDLNLSEQQISMRATEEGGKTKATMNYTGGAKKIIETLLKTAPQP